MDRLLHGPGRKMPRMVAALRNRGIAGAGGLEMRAWPDPASGGSV